MLPYVAMHCMLRTQLCVTLMIQVVEDMAETQSFSLYYVQYVSLFNKSYIFLNLHFSNLEIVSWTKSIKVALIKKRL